jgi:TPP-dependent pyruvate/acetoin dehydrogenase alpha subunit
MVDSEGVLMVTSSKTRAANAMVGSHSAPVGKDLKLTVNTGALQRLYSLMLKCRMVEERAGAPTHYEAAEIGMMVELTADDTIAPARRSVAIDVARGLPVRQILSRNGTSPDALPVANVIPAEGAGASQLSIASGVALGYKLAEKPSIVVAFTDASALGLGGSHEALTFATLHKLPLIVVVRSAAADATHSQSTLSAKAQAYGIPGISVDGNDPVAVYRVGREAINRARGGRGPSLVECCDSDLDALAHMERYLQKHAMWPRNWKQQLTVEFKRELDAGRP